ncbi:MAG: hypothetical protein HND42_05175 [Armatimonadetes bacterium]|nr:hypothetical protein [Armatimonadota bacterium]NOG92617.1 hypothetical protein [Armatimonadota bacterium]
MRRFNSEGIDRRDLVMVLQTPALVRKATVANRCLICCSHGVNAAGLCEGCSANLTEQEYRAALPWIEGTRT